MNSAMLLVITAGLLVGISTGGFVNDPIAAPSWASFEIFQDYTPVTIGPGWLRPGYQPFNLSDWIQPEPLTTIIDLPPPHLEPIPLVIPQPLPISKEELFNSRTTLSAAKQSLLESQKSGSYLK